MKKQPNIKIILLALFILVSLVQIFVPAQMAWQQENTINIGTPYKFKTKPIDPHDPFRGKYITLRYDATDFRETDTSKHWQNYQQVYVTLDTNTEGFATIKDVFENEPNTNDDYIEASISHFSEVNKNISIKFPFNRYYMEESKALDAENYVREATSGPDRSICYGLVYVDNGKAVLADVVVDGVSIKDVVEQIKEVQ